MKLKKSLKSVGYVLFTNIVSLLISAIVTFIVPKQLGIQNYGYFQLYVFYSSYTGFLHFGWADGILLRYTGKNYDELNRPMFSGQFWLYSIVELVLAIAIIVVGCVSFPSNDKTIVVALTGFSVILLLPRTLLQYILQGTNRIGEYSALILIEKIVYIVIVIIALLAGTCSYLPMVFADLLGKMISLVCAVYLCREIVFSKPEKLQSGLKEAVVNISVGVKLMFANIASMLIIGLIRMSIENQWDVATFGKVSLTMSISNFLMVFINAVALVMFPLLRRTNSDKLTSIYDVMRTFLMVPILGMLVLYYPVRVILSGWLPQYADSLVYMALLFPMCVYESKMSMLITTYMKTLRKEKWILNVNLITVFLSFITTMINAYWLHNLDLTIMSIVALLAFRCILAETMLAKELGIHVVQDIILELILTIVFIVSSWYIGNVTGLMIYIVAYVIYLMLERKKIYSAVQTFKKLLA